MINKSLNKKGQVAVYVIIAILIGLLIIGVFWYKKYAGEESEISETQVTEIVSEQSQVLASRVDECLEKLTASGLDLIGLQGGYIYLPGDIERGMFKNNEGKEVVFKGDTLDVEINKPGYNKIPYWVDSDSFSIPSKTFIEEELEDYLEMNIPYCVNNFGDIRDRGMNVNAEKLEADVSLSDFVYVKLKWPISAQDPGNNTFTFEKTEYKYPVDFNNIYRTAFMLASGELVHTYLENHAKSLISLYSYAGGDKEEHNLPPFSLTITNQDCSAVSWTKSEVKNDLKSIFYKNYPYLKIAGTNFTKTATGNPATQGVYDGFVLDYFEPMPNITIDFRYAPENDLYFDISPSSGDSINPERDSQLGIPFIPNFCNLEYRYKYSLEIPVLVKIRDSNSIKYKEGYSFYFPMKASICGNQNRQCVAAPAYRQNMSPNTIFGENVEARMYNCSDVDKTVNISVKLPDSSPASDVDITHTCSGFINECYLGRTRSDGLWKAKIPKCATSVLILQKQGYATIKDSIKESYELEEIKNYSLSVNLIKASLFLKNYYLSNGFTSVHPNCIVVYGATQDLLRQTKSPLRKQGDKVTITLGGDYLEIPIIIYPSQSSIRLNSGKFNVSTSYT